MLSKSPPSTATESRKPLRPVQTHFTRRAMVALGVVLLAAAFSQRAYQNLRRIDYRNSNFVFFWMAGRMVALGQSPYDAPAWLEQHELNQVSWRADHVFSYPLPVALIMVPLGLLSLERAYVVWQIFSQIIMAVVVSIVLRASATPRREMVYFPLVLALLFFGPMYLTLQIGGLGAVALGATTAGIMALDRRREIVAGALLSLLLLKPSQGLPILLLSSVWLLSRRFGKSIYGIGLGSLALLLAGMLLDPGWPTVFMRSAQGLMTRNLGLHSNVFSIARHACGTNELCTWVAGGVAALLLGAATMVYLWRHRQTLTHWEAFSLIIPIAFLAAPYAWSYDQILFVIPIACIVGRLMAFPRGSLLGLTFMVFVIVLSLAALAVHAYAGTDLMSSVTTFLILLGIGVLRSKSPASAPEPAPGPSAGKAEGKA